MAAAVLTVLDNMPRDARPFSAADFAKKIVGEEFDELTSRVKATNANLQRAINSDYELGLGRRSSRSKIVAGLRAREAKEAVDNRDAVGRAMKGGG